MEKPRRNHLYALGSGGVAEVLLLCLLARHGNFLRAGEAWRFTACGVAAGVAYWLAASSFARANLSARQRRRIFWSGAVVLRLAVATVEPGDDLWRYRWEGMIQLHGFNPYALSPDAPPLASLRDADWSKINHRNFAAIYPPFAQGCFAALAWLGNSVWLYKALFALTDLAICAVARKLLVQVRINPDRAVWYAWNPLAVYAFAGAAHFDGLMILPLLGAVWMLGRFVDGQGRSSGESASARSPAALWTSALLLGVAIGVKFIPVVLLPVWGFAAGSWRRALGLIPFAGLPLALSAVAYGFPGVPVFATLQRFGRVFRVNDPVWSTLESIAGASPSGGNTVYGCLTASACLLVAFWFRRDWRRGLLWVWGAALLLSPVVHAWYVLWVLPIGVWRGSPAKAWFVLSISMFGYFLLWEVNHESGRPWEEPLWLRLSIYLPPLVVVLVSITRRRRSGAPMNRISSRLSPLHPTAKDGNKASEAFSPPSFHFFR